MHGTQAVAEPKKKLDIPYGIYYVTIYILTAPCVRRYRLVSNQYNYY